ncbi:EboA domain-containing protein [Hyphomicrobium sp. D-2]|uniref:EboA domain-containing protein n=1 Tax=Hyphomicrobium sp. D-2 TaxID=3041621 RepID=UPI0024558E05|nr:EboA domain-containing protein [Hyphomicrobium sp. D-2]MDH4981954.1 EboA domain-containing protein [Hyphomicrobium sp. D-2]
MQDGSEIATRMGLLRGWLTARVSPEALQWLDDQAAKIAAAPDAPVLTMSIGLAPRKVGKAPLDLTAQELAVAAAVRPGFNARDWSADQAARVFLLLASADSSAGAEGFAARLDRLFRSGEIGEQLALLRGLPLYPRAEANLATAGEGIRSAVQPIFEAVAHNSPYPAEQFSEAMWNQMVVKTLFINSTLVPIVKLDERRNADLARMLVDYAHERWAAGRVVSPELWRCVGPFAGNRYLDDLARVFRSADRDEHRAGALALFECATPEALALLDADGPLTASIRSGELTWDRLYDAGIAKLSDHPSLP